MRNDPARAAALAAALRYGCPLVAAAREPGLREELMRLNATHLGTGTMTPTAGAVAAVTAALEGVLLDRVRLAKAA